MYLYGTEVCGVYIGGQGAITLSHLKMEYRHLKPLTICSCSSNQEKRTFSVFIVLIVDSKNTFFCSMAPHQ